jgi:clan AA aspartic protease
VIQGTVVGLQARINLLICLPGQADVAVDCVVDTGFEGFLTLPLATIAELSLSYAGRIDANLADGSNVSTDVYWATIRWRGVEREIAVLGMGHRPLIGTALLEDSHLSIDFCDGGTVLVDDIL